MTADRPPAAEDQHAASTRPTRRARLVRGFRHEDEPDERTGPAPAPWTARQVVVIAVVIAGVVAAHAWWIHRYRLGYGVSEDEARLLGDALRFRAGYLSQGVPGIWRAWSWPSDITPGVPLLAGALLRRATTPEIVVYLELPFAVLLLAAVADIGRRLAGFRSALASTLVVATLPGTVWWSRVFELIVPGAALWAATVAALLASEGLRVRRWAIGAGVLLGLGLLTRSMLIGFVPVLLIALVAQQLARRVPVRRSAARLAWFLGPAALVAATYWIRGGANMVGYLLDQGSGRSRSLTQVPDEWDLLVRVMGRPALVLVGLGLVASAIAIVRRHPDRTVVPTLLASDRMLLLWTALGSFAVLCVVQEEFPGFELIVAVLLVPAALAVPWSGRWRLLAAPLAVVLVIQGSAFLSPRASWYQQFARQEQLTVPGDRPAAALQGWATAAQAIVATLRETVPDRTQPVLIASSEAFLRGSHLRYWEYWNGQDLQFRDAPSSPPGAEERDELVSGIAAAITVGDAPEIVALDRLLSDRGFVVTEVQALPSGEVARVWVPSG